MGVLRVPLALAVMAGVAGCAFALGIDKNYVDVGDASLFPRPEGGPGGDGGPGGSESGTTPPPLDAGPDACRGLPCAAGQISCGDTFCGVDDQECCIDRDSGVGECVSSGSCASSKIRLRCDEEADCNDGEDCCFYGTASSIIAECNAAPCERQGKSYVTACRSSEECGDAGGTCLYQRCGQGTVMTCQPIPGGICGAVSQP